jgi:hypothetical protein
MSNHKVELHLRIPVDVKARVVARLIEKYHPGLPPQGAQSEFIVQAIERELAIVEAAVNKASGSKS